MSHLKLTTFSFTFIGLSLLASLSVTPAQAIIILPPLLLIPILHLLGGMTAIMSIPTAIFSAVVTYFKKPRSKKVFIIQTIAFTAILLCVFAIAFFVFLKIQNPNRPLL